MDRKVIVDIQRMKTLMGVLNEQIGQPYSPTIGYEKGKAQYKAVQIGAGTQYPLIIADKKLDVVGEYDPSSPVGEGIVIDDYRVLLWQSGKGVTAKDFIENVKVDENGNEYIDYTGKKFCLPDKDFWKAFQSGNVVYKFEFPKNGKVFTMLMETESQVAMPFIGADGTQVNKTVTGMEASMECKGGSNGWGFVLTNGNIFYVDEGGSFASYDINNPEHFSLKSDARDLWEKYGWIVEVGVGILAAFVSGGLSLFVQGALGITSAVGTYLTVVGVNFVTELAFMSPIIYDKFMNGREEEAYFDIVLCAIPFLTELPAAKKFITSGIQPGVTDSVIKKLAAKGGMASFKDNPQRFYDYIDSLTAQELMVFKAAGEQIANEEGIKQFQKALTDYMYVHQGTIATELMGNSKKVVQLDNMTGGKFSKWGSTVLKQNPITGTGFLGQMIRVGLPIAGGVIGAKKLGQFFQNMKNKGYTDEQLEEYAKKLQESLLASPLIKKYIQYNETKTRELLDKSMQRYIDEGYAEKDILKVKEQALSNPEMTKQFEAIVTKEIKENPEKYKELTYAENSTPDNTEYLNDYLNRFLKDYFEEDLKYTNVNITNKNPLKTFTLTSNQENGEILVNKDIKKLNDIYSIDFTKDITIEKK